MRKINRIYWLRGVIIGVVWVGMLTACGGRRAQPESVPANPPQATTAPQATAGPQKAQPTTVPAPVQPTAEPPAATSTPTATPAPVATATATPAKSSESGAALEQVLEQLFNANNSADQLNDVPQVK